LNAIFELAFDKLQVAQRLVKEIEGAARSRRST
jgi:hypothetical protein